MQALSFDSDPLAKTEMTERLSIANIDARLPVTNEERGVAG